MIQLFCLWAILLASLILYLILREEQLVAQGKIPMGRLRRLWLRSEQRGAPRYRITWPIRYQRVAGESLPAEPGNLSQTGAGILIRERLETGTTLHLYFAPPGQPHSNVLAGTVQWVRQVPPRGKQSSHENLFFIGIKFNQMPEETEQQLTKALPSSSRKPEFHVEG